MCNRKPFSHQADTMGLSLAVYRRRVVADRARCHGNSSQVHKSGTSDFHSQTPNTGAARIASVAPSDDLRRDARHSAYPLGSCSNTFCGLSATLAARDATG
ncbi:hypothetical protein EVAR_39456_1 [Eumeta japonica]|uniref:Uncharacterized protein n=1 Tax=Eumeta variegata TaxID=151549 RepID=A0A4C1VZH7_EUMVA|nr:hypothetical protein EVAR_39456_1 [Eumeta japonica]